MEKGKAKQSTSVTTSLRNLQLTDNTVVSSSTLDSVAFTLQSQFLNSNKRKGPPSLLSLCLGVVGSNLEDIIDDLAEIALTFPSDIKLVLLAIARRRKMLNDEVVIALADSSWEMLDLSGSDVSDCGLCHIVDICQNLRVVDISRCSSLTPAGVSKLLQHCHSLQILRWGYTLFLRSQTVVSFPSKSFMSALGHVSMPLSVTACMLLTSDVRCLHVKLFFIGVPAGECAKRVICEDMSHLTEEVELGKKLGRSV